jgi:hypothetical protein
VRWYERLLGRPPDLVPNDREAAWRLTDSGWLCLYAGLESCASAPHTLLVDDLDRFLAGVVERGIIPGPIETIGGAVRQSVIVDPDGNRLKVGQPDVEQARPGAGRTAKEPR